MHTLRHVKCAKYLENSIILVSWSKRFQVVWWANKLSSSRSAVKYKLLRSYCCASPNESKPVLLHLWQWDESKGRPLVYILCWFPRTPMPAVHQSCPAAEVHRSNMAWHSLGLYSGAVCPPPCCVFSENRRHIHQWFVLFIPRIHHIECIIHTLTVANVRLWA